MSSAATTGAAAAATTATTTPTPTMTNAGTDKKSVKVRCGHAIPDFTKLRQELRQRCKQRIKETRDELFTQRRFGVTSSSDVELKLKEIFEEELVDLVTDGSDEVQKHIDSKELIDELRTELANLVDEKETVAKED